MKERSKKNRERTGESTTNKMIKSDIPCSDVSLTSPVFTVADS